MKLTRELARRFEDHLADAQAMGCRVAFGGAVFESTSRTNQMACGLQVAYTAAWWRQRGAKLG